MMTSEYRDIPEHEHTHSLFIHCLNCDLFGIPMPSKFIDAVECGNCSSMETVKYYPSCCIVADRERLKICHDPNCPLIPKHTVNVCKDFIEGMGFMDHNEVPPID